MEVAVGAGSGAFVLVNNRTEGNAPLTVQGLVGMLQARSPQAVPLSMI